MTSSDPILANRLSSLACCFARATSARKLDGAIGTKIVFEKVLMVGEGERSKVGSPTVQGASVEAEITAQNRAKKVVVFKFKQRKKYRKKQGHRQPYTELKVTGIKG